MKNILKMVVLIFSPIISLCSSSPWTSSYPLYIQCGKFDVIPTAIPVPPTYLAPTSFISNYAHSLTSNSNDSYSGIVII